MRTDIIYLACPYSHKDRYIRVARWIASNHIAAKMMSLGLYVFSPISHTHPIEEASGGKLPQGWDYWEKYDRQYLSIVKKIVVLQIDGWKESTGVQAEIKIGAEQGIPVEYVEYDLTPSYEDVVKNCKWLVANPELANRY